MAIFKCRVSAGIKNGENSFLLLVLLPGDLPGKAPGLFAETLDAQFTPSQRSGFPETSLRRIVYYVFVFLMYRLALLSNTAQEPHS